MANPNAFGAGFATYVSRSIFTIRLDHRAEIGPRRRRRLAPGRGLRKAWAKSREDEMKLAKIALLGIALALAASAASPASSQQAEPPKGFAAKLKAKYHEKRQKYFARVKHLYFACGCKVLTSEAGIVPLTSSESYLAFIGDQTIIDVRDEDMRK